MPNTLANKLMGMYAFANLQVTGPVIRYSRGFKSVTVAGAGRYNYTFEDEYDLDIETQATALVTLQSTILSGSWHVRKITNQVIQVYTSAFSGADQSFDHWLLVERIV